MVFLQLGRLDDKTVRNIISSFWKENQENLLALIKKSVSFSVIIFLRPKSWSPIQVTFGLSGHQGYCYLPDEIVITGSRKIADMICISERAVN
jgi:hypothetical protein